MPNHTLHMKSARSRNGGVSVDGVPAGDVTRAHGGWWGQFRIPVAPFDAPLCVKFDTAEDAAAAVARAYARAKRGGCTVDEAAREAVA